MLLYISKVLDDIRAKQTESPHLGVSYAQVAGMFLVYAFDELREMHGELRDTYIEMCARHSIKITSEIEISAQGNGALARAGQIMEQIKYIARGYEELIKAAEFIKSLTKVKMEEREIVPFIRVESARNEYVDIAACTIILTREYVNALTDAYRTACGKQVGGGFTEGDCTASADIRGRKLASLLQYNVQ